MIIIQTDKQTIFDFPSQITTAVTSTYQYHNFIISPFNFPPFPVKIISNILLLGSISSELTKTAQLGSYKDSEICKSFQSENKYIPFFSVTS